MKTGILSRKVTQKRPTRISQKARRLIVKTVKRCKSQRQAARVLRLPTHAQLVAMLEGRIGETPAMKAALMKAEARAERAFYMERDLPADTLRIEQERRLVKELRWILDVLSASIGADK
jgi:hypothetical protein